jgi:hypothetical protein
LSAAASSGDKSSSPSLTIPVVAGLAVGIVLIFLLSVAVEQAPQVSAEMTAAGKVVCLPHKKSLLGEGVPETDECRGGFLRIDNGKYYALHVEDDDQKYYWIFSTNQSNELINVTGTIRPALGTDHYERYDIAGVIDNISSVGAADGHISIYEVAYAYDKQLSSILDKIHAKTGGGYSMGVDKECSGSSNNGSGSSNPCIRITLEKDDPELRKQIPNQLEGFMVDVQILNR